MQWQQGLYLRLSNGTLCNGHISNALKGFPSTFMEVLEDEKRILEFKANAIKTIESVLEEEGSGSMQVIHNSFINRSHTYLNTSRGTVILCWY